MIRPDSAYPPGPTDRRILLVDDNAPARNALSRILAREGYETTSVSDGRSALAVMNNGPAPAVVLTDMILPDVDGRELARHASRLVPRPLVVLLTGWSQEFDDDELGAWGIDAMFLKPLDLKGLLRTLREALDDTKV